MLIMAELLTASPLKAFLADGDASSFNNSFIQNVLPFFGNNDTRQLSANECFQEFRDWIGGQIAFNPVDGSSIKFLSQKEDNIRMEKLSQRGGKYTFCKSVDKIVSKFVSGEWVIEDGPRDPGGFGMDTISQLLVIAKLLDTAKLIMPENFESDDPDKRRLVLDYVWRSMHPMLDPPESLYKFINF